MRDDLNRAVDARIDAYRPEATPPYEAIEARRRHRGRGRLAGGAAALAGIAATAFVVPGLGGTGPERSEQLAPVAAPAWDGRSGPLAATGDGVSDCTGYTLAGLGERTFAFDGTVTAIGDDVSNRPGMGQLSLAGVTFSVNEWFRGDGPDSFTVDLPRSAAAGFESDYGASYGIGTRLLVAGEPRWGGDAAFDQPIAWICGFTRYYDPETAQVWRQALTDPGSLVPKLDTQAYLARMDDCAEGKGIMVRRLPGGGSQWGVPPGQGDALPKARAECQAELGVTAEPGAPASPTG